MNNLPNNNTNGGGYNQPPPKPPSQYPPPSGYNQPPYQNYVQPQPSFYNGQNKPPSKNSNNTVVIVLGVVAVAAIFLIGFIAYLLLGRTPATVSNKPVVATVSSLATPTTEANAIATFPTAAPKPIATVRPVPTTSNTTPSTNVQTPIYPGAKTVEIPARVQEDFLVGMSDRSATESAKLEAYVVQANATEINEFYSDKLTATGWEDFTDQIGDNFAPITDLDGSVIAYTKLPLLLIIIQLPSTIAESPDFGIEVKPEDTLILVITTRV